MLNVLQPGTKVAVHRHLKTSETAICVEGCIDWIFYEELPNVDAGVPAGPCVTDYDVHYIVECIKEAIVK